MQTRLLSLEVFLALLGVAATLSTLSALSTPVAAIPTTATLHTAVPTECGSYFVWQSIGLVYSHRKIKQPGQLTRIVSCTPEEWEAMSTESREFVQTHVAPNYAVHPRTGDKYPAYNKPMAVIDWLAKTDVKEDYVLIIDADMIMRRPIVPDPSSPLATSAFFGYMIGVNNELAVKHIPEVAPRDDELAGPKGRRSDMAGGFTMMRTDQLRKVAPLWLQYTEDVRADPDAWKLSGDQYATNPGDKPWISEMYGYSYACAKADVWHKTPVGMMRYPGYDVQTPPHVLHYGLAWKVGDHYTFDKHWYYGFDPFLCPPWNLGDDPPDEAGQRSNKGGLFPHPPSPSSFKTDGMALLADLLSVEPVIVLNAAMCERHLAKCSPSPELERQCARAKALEAELDERMAALLPGLPDLCENVHPKCEQWALSGECSKNPTYMMTKCVKACGFCFGGVDTPVVLEADAHSVKTEQVAGRGAGGAQSRHDVDAALEDPYEDPGEGTAIEGTAIGGTVIGDESFETPGRGASSDVPDGVLERLFSRCREHAAMWSAQEVTECVELANQGIMYQNHGDAGDADRSTVETTRATSTTAETEPMSLAAIISANLNMKEKLLLGACGSYLAWYVASRRQAGAASRLSRYRKQLRDKNDRLPVRT